MGEECHLMQHIHKKVDTMKAKVDQGTSKMNAYTAKTP
jgi:hypothetical protein